MSEQVPTQNIIDKIIKLLALADKTRGATEAEAEIAASKVQEMLQQYGLSIAEITAQGGKVGDGAREKKVVQRGAMYKWQGRLMATLAETNFCVHRIHEERNPQTGRMSKRHQLIGRTLNVQATELVYEYLLGAMKRMVSEAGHAPGTGSEKDYHYWLEGCADRLCERLKDKAREAKEESDRKKREDEMRSRHPGAASTKNALVVLSDVYASEDDLNQDFINGWEPGTTARRRAEAEAKVRARDAKYNELLAQGVEEIEAWYRANGYEPDRAKALSAEYRKEAAKESKSSSRSYRGGGGRYSGYTQADAREDAKRSSSSYRAGAHAGGQIGLDPQVSGGKTKRIS